MIYFLIIILDLLFKLFLNKLIFFGLLISLLFFLNNKRNFLIIYFFSSLINDWILILPFGFTGFYFGLVLIFLLIIKKYFSFEREFIVYLITFISLFLFLFSIWFIYFKININLIFFKWLLINFLFAIIFKFLDKNILK